MIRAAWLDRRAEVGVLPMTMPEENRSTARAGDPQDAPRYDIRDTAFPSKKPEKFDSAGMGAVVAIDQYAAIEFRDQDGTLSHANPLSDNYSLFQLKNYLEYVKSGVYFDIPHTALKSSFITNILAVVRKIAAHKKSISILEIGSTIGENFLFLKNSVEFENLGCDISFVGVEVSGSMVEFSRELHRDTANVHFVHAEASDLSRFPDRTFDICISHGVSNHTEKAIKGFKELLRISRIATVSHMYVSEGDRSISLTHAAAGYTMWIPTFDEIKRHAGAAPQMLLYNLSKFRRVNAHVFDGTGDGYFIEDLAGTDIFWGNFVFARFPLLPEVEFLNLQETLSTDA
jgi:ubiquinone/menaquinone biosynthesis C-methylase UbiE